MPKKMTDNRGVDQTSEKPKVFVGISGGVDSSVSAALLSRSFDVTGVFIKVWSPDFLPCTWREDRLDAMRVCAHLDIPFITLDLEKEYKKEVVDYMIAEYKAGRTPNPDVMCNKKIKFGAFYDFAIKSGADFVATGHYVQNNKIENIYHLVESNDKAKEQSYFRWNITKEQLPHILFPIGGMEKKAVRKLAEKFDLPNATKRDSQGLCFIGKVDMKEFLGRFIPAKEGNVLNIYGKKIGTHTGAVFLTIGQRHGFTIVNTGAEAKAHYIVSKDVKRNTIIVSALEPNDMLEIGKLSCALSNTNWITEPNPGKNYLVRFRYHQVPLLCTLFKEGEIWHIHLAKLFVGISVGQSAVVYNGDVLIGGGIIEQ